MKTKAIGRARPAPTVEQHRKRYQAAIKMLRQNHERRLELWEQISSLLDRGFDFPTVFQVIWAGQSSDGLRPHAPVAVVAAEWRQLARDNVPFNVIAEHCTTPRERLYITAGIETSQLANVLRRLAASERVLYDMKAQWRDSIRSPLFNTAWAWVMAAGFCYMILWQYSGRFHLNPIGWALVAYNFASNFLYFWSWFVPLVAGLVGLTIRWALPNWLSNARPRYEHLWPFNLYKGLAAAEFLQALSIFISARHDVSPSLKKIALCATKYLRWQIDQIEPWTRGGNSIGSALKNAHRAFPDPVPNALIQVFCSDSERFHLHLENITENYSKELTKLFVKNIRRTTQITFAFVVLLNIMITLLMTATGLPSSS
jgi:type II secretory pathway component PulF